MNADDDLPRHIIAALPRPIAADVIRPDFRFLAAAAAKRRRERICRGCDAPLPPRAVRYCSYECWRRRP